MKSTKSPHWAFKAIATAMAVLTCQASLSHPDAMENNIPTVPGGGPGSGQGSPQQVESMVSSAEMPERGISLSESAMCRPNVTPESVEFSGDDKTKFQMIVDYVPKISLGVGFVAHLHPDDATKKQHLQAVPNKQFAELWYLTKKRWLDQAGTRRCYCVIPRIEVVGGVAWRQTFEITLKQGSREPFLAFTPDKRASVTPTPPSYFAPGSSHELMPVNDWCFNRSTAEGPPELTIVTRYGSRSVDFGERPMPPVRPIVPGAPVTTNNPATTPR